MRFFKRGMLSIVRKPVRTSILFLVIFIIGALLSSSISIKNAIDTTKGTIIDSVEPVAIIDMDWKKMNEEMEASSPESVYEGPVHPDVALIQSIGELEYVKYYDYNIKQYINVVGEQGEGMVIPCARENVDIKYYYPDLGTLIMYGVNFPDIITIQEGIIDLVDGRTLTEEEVRVGKPVAVIGEKLAEKNNLQVGSTLKTKSTIYDYENSPVDAEVPTVYDTVLIELEVVGIFSIPEETSENKKGVQGIDARIGQENTIYTTNEYTAKVHQELSQKTSKLYNRDSNAGFAYQPIYSPIYILKDVTMLEDFRKEVTPLLPNYYRVVDTTESYSAINVPLEKLDSISDTVLFATIGGSLLIVSVLTTVFLYYRRHEMVTYISMGERKSKVILQIIVEVMTIAIVALTVSLFVSHIVTKDISKERILEDARFDANDGYPDYDFGGLATVESIYPTQVIKDTYEVILDGKTIALFYGISVGTVVVSMIVPILYIAWLKPKKVVMKSINNVREEPEDEFF